MMVKMQTKMSITKINRLRKKAEKICGSINDIFESGWTPIDFDPLNLLDLFPSITLMEGVVLKAYIYRTGGNGNGRMYAFPIEYSLDPDIDLVDKDLFVEKPENALENLMDAIEGDGLPWSYFSASLFAREAAEFGALWHGVNWGTHEIIGKDPTGSDDDLTLQVPPDTEWKWLKAKPDSWSPVVIQEPKKITVRFYSRSSYNIEAIYEHTDIYRPLNYSFVETKEETIATGSRGYIF